MLSFVDPPGLEPGTTEPKSAVLPLHHGSVRIDSANILSKIISTKYSCEKIVVERDNRVLNKGFESIKNKKAVLSCLL